MKINNNINKILKFALLIFSYDCMVYKSMPSSSLFFSSSPLATMILDIAGWGEAEVRPLWLPGARHQCQPSPWTRWSCFLLVSRSRLPERGSKLGISLKMIRWWWQSLLQEIILIMTSSHWLPYGSYWHWCCEIKVFLMLIADADNNADAADACYLRRWESTAWGAEKQWQW